VTTHHAHGSEDTERKRWRVGALLRRFETRRHIGTERPAVSMVRAEHAHPAGLRDRGLVVTDCAVTAATRGPQWTEHGIVQTGNTHRVVATGGPA
jgi:hypothetical protein